MELKNDVSVYDTISKKLLCINSDIKYDMTMGLNRSYYITSYSNLIYDIKNILQCILFGITKWCGYILYYSRKLTVYKI